MRIISQGKKPEDRLYTAKCHNCATVVEFSRGEAKYHPDQRDGDYLSVGCPTCGQAITAQAN